MLQIPVLNIVLEMYENAIKLYKNADVIVNTSLLDDYLSSNCMQYGLCQLFLNPFSTSAEKMKQLSDYIHQICIKLDIPFKFIEFNVFYVGDGPLYRSIHQERDIKYRIQILQYMLEQN